MHDMQQVKSEKKLEGFAHSKTSSDLAFSLPACQEPRIWKVTCCSVARMLTRLDENRHDKPPDSPTCGGRQRSPNLGLEP